MHKLERKKKAILKEIFFQSTTAPAGVEAAWFRAQRESELDLMDELEALEIIQPLSRPGIMDLKKAFDQVFKRIL